MEYQSEQSARDIEGKPGWRAAAHCDGIMLNPTAYLDGEIIEKNGKYVHP